MPVRNATDTTETTEVSDPAALIASVTETVTAVTEMLTTLATTLGNREAVIAIASDGMLADEAHRSVEGLDPILRRVRERIGQVRELSATIDRLADPMLLQEIR